MLLFGVLFTMRTPDGTLVIESDDPNVQMAVKQGGQVVEVVDARSGWKLSLKSGQYELAPQGSTDQFQLDRDSVTVRRGDVVKVKLTLKRPSSPLLPGEGQGVRVAEIPNSKSQISNRKSEIPPPAVAPFDEKKAKEHQEAWAKYLGVPVEITNSIGMRLVLIPPGEFMMGSPKELIEEELKRPDNDQWYKVHLPAEGPQHRVRITKPFYLGTYLVTQQEYQRVMGTNPSEFSATGKGKDKVAGQDTKRFPVECVSWDDTVAFCRKLSEMPEERSAGRTYQLPSEAQWEYACRAGSMGRYSFSMGGKAFPKEHDENGLSDYGWFDNNADGRLHAVGERKPNAWGLYDMHGNLWEWCQDCYDKEYYANSPVDDPAGPSGGPSRVLRGGGWYYPAEDCRSARRGGDLCGGRNDRGFRVCLVLPDRAGGSKTAPSTESSVLSTQTAVPTPNPQPQLSPPPADPDRRAAEWVIGLGGVVRISEADHDRVVSTMEDLPKAGFKCLTLDLRNAKATDSCLDQWSDWPRIEGTDGFHWSIGGMSGSTAKK